MKVLSLFIATAALLFGAANASAGSCGAGIITHIKEGGWDEDAFLIHIDDSVESPEHPMYRVQWVRFSNGLNPDRFRGIKALAYMAFSAGKPVRAYTSGTNCNVADDLTIFLDPASPEPS